MLDKFTRYIFEDIWNFSLQKETGLRYFFLKWVRILLLSFRGFWVGSCITNASSLTYCVLLSVIPILSFVLTTTHLIGYDQLFKEQLLTIFQRHETIILEFFKYSDIALSQTSGNILAAFISFLSLFATGVIFLASLEGALNMIWGVPDLRSLHRICLDYLVILVLAPLLFIGANVAAFYVVGFLAKTAGDFSATVLFLIKLIPHSLFWFLFAFTYYFMPNTKVRFSSALYAGIIGGSLYLFMQWGYFHSQVLAIRLSALYGAMAVLPFFLIWSQLSWLIFLFGAEISHAHQTVLQHEFEGKASRISFRTTRLLTLRLIQIAIQKGALNQDDLMRQYHLPAAVVAPILKKLVESSLLHKDKDSLVPDPNLEEITLAACLRKIDLAGENEFSFLPTLGLESLEKTLDNLQKLIEGSSENVPIKNILS